MNSSDDNVSVESATVAGDAGGVLATLSLIVSMVALRFGDFPDVSTVAGVGIAVVAVPIALRLVFRSRSAGPNALLRLILALAVVSVVLGVAGALSIVG